MAEAIKIPLSGKMKKRLEEIAAIQEKSLISIVNEILQDYIRKLSEKSDEKEQAMTQATMRLSEDAFKEWDNQEDEIYDSL